VDFEIEYRWKTADSWPKSLNDSAAKREWGWKPDYDMKAMVKEVIHNLSKKLGIQ